MARCAATAAVLGLLAHSSHAAGVDRSDGIGNVDIQGMKDTLSSGGAEALANMLATMKAQQEMNGPVDKDKKFHIAHRGGRAIYDFSDQAPKATTTKAPPAAITPALLAKFPWMAKTLPKGQLAPGKAPAAPAAPVASAAPVAMTAGAPPMMQTPMQSASPTFLMNTGAQGQSANQMQALARGLETIRERIDSLAGEAVAAVQGGTMQLPQSSMPVAAVQAQPGTVPAAAAAPSAASDKLEKEFEALAKRVTGLEQDNHDLHDRIKKEDSQLKTDEAKATKDRAQVAALAKENAELKANVTKLSRRRLRMRKGAKPSVAKVVKQ